jgi:hypothetical protein
LPSITASPPDDDQDCRFTLQPGIFPRPALERSDALAVEGYWRRLSRKPLLFVLSCTELCQIYAQQTCPPGTKTGSCV